MLKSKRILGLTLLLACAGFAAKANAEDAYYSIPLENLTQASLPKYDEAKINWQRLQQLLPHLALEQAGQETEAYLDTQPGSILFFIRGSARAGADRGALRLLARAPEGKDIVGKLFVPNVDLTGMIAIPFKITAAQATPDAKQPFLQAKKQHYEHLATQNIPGEAWFRHQTRLAKLALPTEKQPENINRNRWQRDGSSTLEDTYNLFTGARAMSENLQLDRALPVAAADETPVKIDSLEGITVAEIDWAPLIKDAKPKLDPLASKIPFDQHANFFPTFQAALAVADEA
ncbi:MAG: hypothetical protein FWD53_07430, partial [Phycisphaerales bacterium]|nr:hypothetical protein [Phycisphaerales bacterium]